ncbi:MAG: CapA family protein [Polyangiaceae bacterium]|nr:CapA family protein [Polyangiaceae bacterium]
MTGRGVDQILPHPSEPRIHEPFMDDARDYVVLAERVSGPIPRPVDFAYVWGDALDELERAAPDARIINLETSVTRSDRWEDKGINYRMHPDNVPCLSAARIDACALANNHVLDYGEEGLVETLDALSAAGVKRAGAGRDLAEARAPAVIEVPGEGRIVVFAFGTEDSGVSPGWGAAGDRPGVDLLPDLSDATAFEIGERVRRAKRSNDIVVASIHWGGNWGYEVPLEHVRFAHRLVDGGVDLVHGHSSHHPRPIEAHEGKLILYGCGDFLNDYEGIAGHEHFRGDLTLMYFASVVPSTGELQRLEMTPMRIRKLRARRAPLEDARWLQGTIERESAGFGSRVRLERDGRLTLRWS